MMGRRYRFVLKKSVEERAKSLVVAIDFDGTITKDYKFPHNIGVLRDGCKEAIDYIRGKHRVIIWTCRSGEHLAEAVDFLQKNGISYDGINEDYYIKTDRKIMADLYIDDKNIFCQEIDWFKIKEYFEKM